MSPPILNAEPDELESSSAEQLPGSDDPYLQPAIAASPLDGYLDPAPSDNALDFTFGMEAGTSHALRIPVDTQSPLEELGLGSSSSSSIWRVGSVTSGWSSAFGWSMSVQARTTPVSSLTSVVSLADVSLEIREVCGRGERTARAGIGAPGGGGRVGGAGVVVTRRAGGGAGIGMPMSSSVRDVAA